MHPDQATEAIVSCALELGRPFAVVPCCVFPYSFPDRRLPLAPRFDYKFNEDDQTSTSASICRPVVEYADFLEYLQRKPALECGMQRASKEFLSFVGKNCVVFQQP